MKRKNFKKGKIKRVMKVREKGEKEKGKKEINWYVKM